MIATASALFLQPFVARSEGWTPVEPPSTTQSPLEWSTPERDDEDSKQKGVTWNSVDASPNGETTSDAPIRSLVWQPLEQKDVITEDNIVPFSDLDAEKVIAMEPLPAYSRGSMIQIGETVYPNLGYNALQRKPGTWVNLQISAIDDSWQQAPSPCKDGDFLDQCADGLSRNWLSLWADENFSLELQWTIHSLSGEGAPFNFSIGSETFGSGDSGTKFGDGQSLGFRLSKNFGKTFGISLGGDSLFHLDETTDLPKPLYLMGTKIFKLNDTIEPPIISFSAGLMSDVYNPETNLGTITYPKWLRGGQYGSIFSVRYDDFAKDGFAEDTAGVTSAYVCAEQSVYKTPYKPPSAASSDCIHEVFWGPAISLGFAPWPWIGLYAIYQSDLNFGISFKPFKNISWQFGFELVAPIAGINPGLDNFINSTHCPGENISFGSCRTRLGFFTDLSF
ncbi:hypothetical protein [Synechococcus sp. A15-127]|uniref:hypothetical protein n=1 Tax=Synechococcus sp. A15-127 TaxID=1050624 RepID=UPI0016451FE6|nr:hypothetical protein [Synechococcus sp. A15-127]